MATTWGQGYICLHKYQPIKMKEERKEEEEEEEEDEEAELRGYG